MPTLITGGCGFVGLNVCEALQARAEPVVLFDRHALPAAAHTLLAGPPPAVVLGDVRDGALLERTVREHGIDRIVHAATITSGPQREAREPREIIEVNVGGAVNLLQIAKAARCRRLLFVGSGSAYGRTLDEPGPLEEELAPSRPETLYAITKLAAEQAVLRLSSLWGVEALCVRLGTVFGPWEYASGVRDRLSPQLQLAQRAVRGEEAVLPRREVRRDWVYSRDVASGLTALLLADRTPHVLYHITSGLDWKGFFRDWCAALQEAYPRFSWRIAAPHEQPNVHYHAAADRALMDVSRLRQDVGFAARFDAREAAQDFIAWIGACPEFVGGAALAAS